MTLVRFHQPVARPFFNDIWKPDYAGGSVWAGRQPAVNIVSTENGFRLEFALPGWTKEELTVLVEKNLLAISGQKEARPEAAAQPNFLRREFSNNAFRQSFRLPDSIDPESVKAALNNGILTIELSKKPEATPAVRKIEVLSV